MKGEKRFYSLLTVLIAFCAVLSMLYFMNGSNTKNESSYADDHDDGKYLGYIFDDYNKNVNLDYSEDEPLNEGGIMNVISLQALDMDYTVDNIRSVRSERLIDEWALRSGVPERD